MAIVKKYTVFISSTLKDLKEYRASVHDAILSDGNFPIAMENFTASSQSQWNTIQSLINDSDYYVLMIGFKYGSIDLETGLSYTEKEYEYAMSIKKPILSFLLDESFGLDKDDDMIKVEAFRNKVLNNGRLAKFCKEQKNLSADIISALYSEISSSTQTGWIKGASDTYIGLSLNQIDSMLEDNEKEIIKLFEIQNVDSITFSEFMKILKLSKQKFKYYIEHLEELQLLYYDSQYSSDDTNYCELLPDGRKYLMKLYKK